MQGSDASKALIGNGTADIRRMVADVKLTRQSWRRWDACYSAFAPNAATSVKRARVSPPTTIQPATVTRQGQVSPVDSEDRKPMAKPTHLRTAGGSVPAISGVQQNLVRLVHVLGGDRKVVVLRRLTLVTRILLSTSEIGF